MTDTSKNGPEKHVFSSLDQDELLRAETAGGIPLSRLTEGRGIDAVLSVGMTVQVVLGETTMPIADLLNIRRGTVIELDRKIGEPFPLTVGGIIIGHGELVKLEDNKLGITVTATAKKYISKEE